MRIESALVVKRVRVSIHNTWYDRDLILMRSTDQTRVQRGHLARLRASHLCSDPNENGRTREVVEGGEAVD